MIYDELRHEGAFTRCFECDCVVKTRDDARWVTAKRKGRPVRYLACIECADGTNQDFVERVETHPLMAELIESDTKIEEAKEVIREETRKKFENIFKLLDEEGYQEGMLFYGIGGEKLIVTGRTRGLKSGREGYVLFHKAKKDGTPHKYGEQKMPWIDFIRLWRMQRADQDLYLKRTEERWRKKNEEFKNRLGEDIEL